MLVLSKSAWTELILENAGTFSSKKKSYSRGDNSHQTGWTAVVSKGGMILRDLTQIGLDLTLTYWLNVDNACLLTSKTSTTRRKAPLPAGIDSDLHQRSWFLSRAISSKRQFPHLLLLGPLQWIRLPQLSYIQDTKQLEIAPSHTESQPNSDSLLPATTLVLFKTIHRGKQARVKSISLFMKKVLYIQFLLISPSLLVVHSIRQGAGEEELLLIQD